MTIKKNDSKVLAYRAEQNPAKKRRLMNELVRENMGLIKQQALKFRWQAPGAELDDLVQEASIAFLYAIDHVDLTRGFTTYFSFRVWHNIHDFYSRCGRTITIPRGESMPLRVLRKIEAFLAQHNRMPTHEDIGETEKAWRGWKFLPATVPLYDPIADGITYADVVSYPEGDKRQEELLDDVREYIEELSILEKRVIVAIFVRNETVAQAARGIGLPVDAVETLRDQALRRIRNAVERDS